MADVKDIKVGLEIAEEYFGGEHQLGGAEHDIIYLFPPDVTLSDEDKARLEAAGWRFSKQEGWFHFV